jgi:hypothetical protein
MAISSSHSCRRAESLSGATIFPSTSNSSQWRFDSLLSVQLTRYPRGFDHLCRGLPARSILQARAANRRTSRQTPPCYARDMPRDNLHQLTCPNGGPVFREPVLVWFFGITENISRMRSANCFVRSRKSISLFNRSAPALLSATLAALPCTWLAPLVPFCILRSYFSLFGLPTS